MKQPTANSAQGHSSLFGGGSGASSSWTFPSHAPDTSADSDSEEVTSRGEVPTLTPIPSQDQRGSLHRKSATPTDSTNVSTNEETGSDTDDDDPEPSEKPWDLRPKTLCYINDIGSTWIDQDDSGNYDPSRGDGASGSNIVKRRRRYQYDDSGVREHREGGTTTSKAISWEQARRTGKAIDVVLKLNFEKGKAFLANYTDNWPEDGWNVITGEGVPPQFANLSDKTQQALQTTATSSSYGLRKRKKKRKREVDFSLLVNHPVARGCRACFETGNPCPLLEPGVSWPCDLCAEDGYDCELITPPKRKQACKECQGQRQHCSYEENGGIGSETCDACAELGFHCFAGPAPDPKRVRMTEDGLPALSAVVSRRRAYRPPRERKQQQRLIKHSKKRMVCRACKNDGKKCPIRRGVVTWPCLTCEEENHTCILEDAELAASVLQVDSRMLALRNHGAALRAKLSGISPAPQMLPPAVVPRGTLTFQISTLLAHPVRYNTPPHTLFKPCHWHLDPAFGLTGLGPPPSTEPIPIDAILNPAPSASVTMALIPSGLGFREIAGGHTTSNGLLPSRMCKECTMTRAVICACPSHHMGYIADEVQEEEEEEEVASEEDPESTLQAQRDEKDRVAWHEAFRALEATKPGTEEHKAQMQRWCALCPQLAKFECRNETAATLMRPRSGNSMVQQCPSGCGLRLCEPCAVVLEDLKGDLHETVLHMREMFGARKDTDGGGGGCPDEVEDDPYEEVRMMMWPLGLRADYEVFARDGFMMAQLLKGGA